GTRPPLGIDVAAAGAVVLVGGRGGRRRGGRPGRGGAGLARVLFLRDDLGGGARPPVAIRPRFLLVAAPEPHADADGAEEQDHDDHGDDADRHHRRGTALAARAGGPGAAAGLRRVPVGVVTALVITLVVAAPGIPALVVAAPGIPALAVTLVAVLRLLVTAVVAAAGTVIGVIAPVVRPVAVGGV